MFPSLVLFARHLLSRTGYSQAVCYLHDVCFLGLDIPKPVLFAFRLFSRTGYAQALSYLHYICFLGLDIRKPSDICITFVFQDWIFPSFVLFAIRVFSRRLDIPKLCVICNTCVFQDWIFPNTGSQPTPWSRTDTDTSRRC